MASKLLRMAVLERSYARTWDEACLEWMWLDMAEDDSVSSDCACSNHGLRYLHKIGNTVTGRVLFPIGSHCIEYFNNKDMTSRMRTMTKVFLLRKSYLQGDMIEMTSDYFTRRMLEELYTEGAIATSSDYDLMKDAYERLNRRIRLDDEVASQVREAMRAMMDRVIENPKYGSDPTEKLSREGFISDEEYSSVVFSEYFDLAHASVITDMRV